MNDFSKLDAQDEMSRLAQVTPEETMSTPEPTLKDQVKAMRQEVRALYEKFGTLQNKVMAQIPAKDMEFTTDKGEFQFWLLEQASHGFHDTMTSLHKLWKTFPQTEAEFNSQFEEWQGDSKEPNAGID